MFSVLQINANTVQENTDENYALNLDSSSLESETVTISAGHDDSLEISSDPINFTSCQNSVQQTSVFLHDYCGHVLTDNISTKLDESEQTDLDSFTESSSKQLTKKILVDAAVQCEIETISTLVQTDNDSPKVVELKSVGIQTTRPDATFEDIQENNEKVMFYTGLPNSGTFKLLFDEMSDAFDQTRRKGAGNNGRPRALRLVDEVFLVLMRLRLGLLLEDLADRFHISKATCSVTVSKWIDYLHVKLSFLISWPSKDTVQTIMPRKFKDKYPTCRIIIDCTELYTETPSPCAISH